MTVDHGRREIPVKVVHTAKTICVVSGKIFLISIAIIMFDHALGCVCEYSCNNKQGNRNIIFFVTFL
jgi:hypothetical protein